MLRALGVNLSVALDATVMVVQWNMPSTTWQRGVGGDVHRAVAAVAAGVELGVSVWRLRLTSRPTRSVANERFLSVVFICDLLLCLSLCDVER